MAARGVKPDRKGHVCPPSDATHPSDRWESLFVYSFILKFTNLKEKILGFESPMDLEEALLSNEPNDILTKILGRFILNLKPQTRNLSTDQMSTTLMGVLAEYFKTSERTMFWDDDVKVNVDPFVGMEAGFFAADWDFKLKILRQLVELQLTHSQEIKAAIDRAWGVVHNKHKKEKGAAAADNSGITKDTLDFLPFGMDHKRERYWVADDSPRVYVSTNPWRLNASFKAVSSTREEYLQVIENLKASLPEPKQGKKRTRNEQFHMELTVGLEERIEKIDLHLARVTKVRKKIEQNRILMAQAELRETRTRRQARRPDYVYYSQDSEDEYQLQEQEDGDFNDEEPEETGRRRKAPIATRRSTRTAVLNANGKREGSSESNLGNWRGERRSARLGFQDPFEVERPPKRARTEESTTSVGSADASSTASVQANSKAIGNGAGKIKVKATGAAALKPTEVAMEQIAGKKKSKFWVYAVEPMVGHELEEPSGKEDVKMDANEDNSPAVNRHGAANGCEGLRIEQSVVVESTA
ncbi:hypothetical protein AN958_06640 [Leucoagaricus sp. SymC.cos]|nr:hypothetical protein AN958_06640 [Leucoagaricus sp. SymC.cos]